jgi:hypothetical protein
VGGCLKLPTKIEFFYLSPRLVKDDKLMSEFQSGFVFARVGFTRSFVLRDSLWTGGIVGRRDGGMEWDRQCG